MRVALVHDYLSQDGGAEQTLRAMREIWPEAPVFVLFHDKKRIAGFGAADVRESFLARLPFGRWKYQWYLPLMPLATELHALRDFDVVVSCTSAFAKGVLTRPETLHISYCHTPTRYLWIDTREYIADLKYPFVVKAILPRLMHRLRLWDRLSADRVDLFVANSCTVQDRIRKYYRRESVVIYPPADTQAFFVASEIGDYFVAGGRLVPYKRLDLVVDVFNRLRWPLKIFGAGPEFAPLSARALPNIQFLGRVSDAQKVALLARAKAFIHPQLEDFGITPVESMAAGRPVIAFGAGGALESVVPCVTGALFYEQSWESLLDALLRFDPYAWDAERIRAHAAQFGQEIFKTRMKIFVEEQYAAYRH